MESRASINGAIKKTKTAYKKLLKIRMSPEITLPKKLKTGPRASVGASVAAVPIGLGVIVPSVLGSAAQAALASAAVLPVLADKKSASQSASMASRERKTSTLNVLAPFSKLKSPQPDKLILSLN